MISFFPWIVMSHEKGSECRPICYFWVRQQQNSKKGILSWEKEYIKWLETAQPINLPCSFWKLLWLNHWGLICGFQTSYFPILLIFKLKIHLAETFFYQSPQTVVSQRNFWTNIFLIHCEVQYNYRSLHSSGFTLNLALDVKGGFPCWILADFFSIIFKANYVHLRCLLFLEKEGAREVAGSKHPFDLSS